MKEVVEEKVLVGVGKDGTLKIWTDGGWVVRP